MHQNTKKYNFALIFTASFLLVFSLTSCGFFNEKKVDKFTKTGFFLDTVVSVTVYSQEDAQFLESCLEGCGRYEKIFSRTDPESELYRLNAAGKAAVSPELLELLETSLFYSSLSEGGFDPSMGAISDMYAFSSESPYYPSDAEISEKLSHTGWEKIIIEGDTVTLADPEAVIDLGAIAKGYIADRLAEMLRSKGVESAIIDLGGNILCVGSKPDGSDYKVGIQYPYKDTGKVITTASLSNMSVVTSGVYQRWFEHEGQLCHHILDPKTGRSINNGLISVSIIGEKSVDCDALSTAVFAMGLEKGIELIDSLENTWAVFITDDMEMHYSEGFEARFG